MADPYAGQRFKHAIAINVWRGFGAPQPPPGTVDLRRFTIGFDSAARRDEVRYGLTDVERRDDGYLTHDLARTPFS